MALIKVEQLSKSFDGKEVVKNLNFELEPGKCVALLGPNGAGKTTTLRMLAGFSKPTKGSIKFDQETLSRDIRQYIGYLPQYPVFHNWMTGKEFLMYVGQLAHMSRKEAGERATELLDRVGLGDVEKKRIGKYSGGMKQRLGIAQAMMHRPTLIMLDEPVSSLDPIGRREVLNLLMELKKEATILFSTHILNDAEEVSDEILLLKQGELIEHGSLDKLSQMYQTARLELDFRSLPEDAQEILRSLEVVEQLTVNRQTVILLVNDADLARKELLKIAAQKDWDITRFELVKSNLEDLFMKAVNR
ncbi:MAG: ABC transporter ATP-binding protein [Bacillaceae bacterium]|nr:ABC transporter ATP-binding protein [Bacillaceae bacterium]